MNSNHANGEDWEPQKGLVEHLLDRERDLKAATEPVPPQVEPEDGAADGLKPFPDSVGTLERTAAERLSAELASIVESSNDSIISVGVDGNILSWNRAAEKLFGYGAAEVMGQACTMILPEPNEERAILKQIQRGEPVETYETIRRCKNGRLVDISLTISPVKDARGAIIGASKIARDISERKRAEQQQRLLVDEMKHRLKNLLATVQAIATQTLKKAAPDELRTFLARVQALGAVHDLLTIEQWNEAPIKGVIDAALKPFRDTYRERLWIEGPDVSLSAQQAMIFTLAVHELATNALKYGALSNGRGRIHAAWQVKAAAPVHVLSFHWVETGGPPVTSPERKGFGSKLLDVMANESGGAYLQFAPEGLICSFEMPLYSGP